MRVYPEEGLTMVKVSEKPKNKFYAFMKWKFLVVIGLICLFFFFFEEYIPNEDNFYSGFLIGIPLLIYVVYVRLGNVFRKENIAFNILGKVYFNYDYIEINSERKYLEEIQQINIENDDYKGQLIVSMDLDEPIHSLGISNFITITYKDSSVEKIQFMQENENHLMWFRNELMHYYNLQLIDYPTIKRVLK
ncbi:hypothetical protein H1R17_01710 [Flavobacterium sp. xlx-214]|uniref:hypothetical protein n=1 Tax=unclassified Flavobacterium TaxID=196869 RepID=UPI0013D13CFE|nr:MULTISPECIES: hypothetical protein [unclassified Flavobacterium]MBA5792738.1 hypothetical protein [Flavobacterium sp. xlx-221]QMI83875.1 hypothetical protein H1R17_01710 [Flavobacterium sp. xlx-214]